MKAKELVFTCSEIPSWNLIKQYRYAERLDELDSSLQRLLNVEFQAAQCHDILKILAEVNKMNQKLDEMNFPEKDGDTDANAVTSTNHGNSKKPSRLFEADYKIKIKNFNMHLRLGIWLFYVGFYCVCIWFCFTSEFGLVSDFGSVFI